MTQKGNIVEHEIKIPKQIKLYALTCLIKHGEAITAELQEQKYYGLFLKDKNARYIWLDASQSPSDLSNTFIHECLEFINQSTLVGELKHRHIVAISNGFHQIFEQLGIRFVK